MTENLRGLAMKVERFRIGHHNVVASGVLQSYWYFAQERQRVYHARLAGDSPPWTIDPVISQYRFTNAYRAADRVSQDLIRIAYDGPQTPENIVLRVLLFRFFNKPSTWRALNDAFGEITTESFDVEAFGLVLDQMLMRDERVYSAAYIVPPPPFGAKRKHRNHLMLIEHMLKSGLDRDLASAKSLQAVYETIQSYPSLGPFLAYQLAIDFNYTKLLDFDENDFVVPGPGARSGIAKCFLDLDGLSHEDVIRWMVDNQVDQFDHYDLFFHDLFGRSLTLIDCQNLFCETDKYARVMHPEIPGSGNRTRIKQQFFQHGSSPAPFFPPKWGINSDANVQLEHALVRL
jgi:hypothetical protein